MNGRRPAVSAQTYHNRSNETYGYSNEKIFFQSFFMLITVQFFFFASGVKVPTLVSGRPCAGP